MIHLKVSGMTCGGCISAVSRAVQAVPGAEDVAVDLARGEVVVKGNPDSGAVRDAIAARGFEVQAA